MKTINYSGFSNVPSSCQYGVGKVGGKDAVVFYQSKNPGTSITNMIEELSTSVLTTEFPGVHPANVRIFEHYDPADNPMIEWQEVRFEDSGIVDNKSPLKKLVALLIPDKTTPKSYVGKPVWLKVSPEDSAQAAAIQ